MRSRDRSLAREITILLALKLAAIALIWAAFFSPAKRPQVDGPSLERHLLNEGQPRR